MSKTKTEIIDEFEIKYRKHIFSKNIKISCKSENSILVTMPYFCPYKTARNFLLSNLDKIKSIDFGFRKYKPDFKTKFDTLKMIESGELKIETKGQIVHFYYPKQSFFDIKTQKKLKEAHLKALKIEAKNYLVSRLEFLAKKYDFKYNKLALKNQKTRFGSCSYQNNINLNINLMNYDFDVIDYVLIHELVHTKVKNHSSVFWSEVERICPNYKNLRKRLKYTP